MLVAAIAAHRSSHAEELISLDAQPPTMMILMDGRVLNGRISERPGGYMIEAPDSKQVVPYEMIRLLASSLEDAYIKQRDALKMPRAGDHLALAQWCFDHKLYGPASEQLESALKLEPNRSDARRLLQQLAEITQPQAASTGPRSKATVGPAAALTRTASGISPETQAEFVRRVQPILVNRCGNAVCHGSAAQNSFRLINVRTGQRQQRLETETNLAAVMQQIDSERPTESPLLVRPTDADSRVHRGAFSATAGTSQQDRLRAWVLQVVRDQNPNRDAWAHDESDFAAQAAYAFGEDPPHSRRDAGVRQAAGEVERVIPGIESPLLIEIPRTPQPAPSADSSGQTPGQVSKAAPASKEQSTFLRQILEQDRPDAFDPNEFNRQAHGRTRVR